MFPFKLKLQVKILVLIFLFLELFKPMISLPLHMLLSSKTRLVPSLPSQSRPVPTRDHLVLLRSPPFFGFLDQPRCFHPVLSARQRGVAFLFCSSSPGFQDKLIIPLILETIPNAQQFKQATSSLSPEQQRFSKGIRSHQLSSTLFTICILPIKSQLEKILNLPKNSLLKEFILNQRLMKVFIELQIPSNLVSYFGDQKIENQQKILYVNQKVEELLNLVDWFRVPIKEPHLKIESGDPDSSDYSNMKKVSFSSLRSSLFLNPGSLQWIQSFSPSHASFS